jgi:hypothetical protein
MAPQPQIYFGKSIDEESNGIFFDFPFCVMVLWSSGPTHCSVPPVFRLLVFGEFWLGASSSSNDVSQWTGASRHGIVFILHTCLYMIGGISFALNLTSSMSCLVS